MPEHYDMIQIRVLADWSGMPPDMIVDEELQRVQRVVGAALDEHYGNDYTIDLVWVTHEGKLPEDEEREGWGEGSEAIWARLPGDTPEEKRAWFNERLREAGWRIPGEDEGS